MIEMLGEYIRVRSMNLSGRGLELSIVIPRDGKFLKRLVNTMKSDRKTDVAICWPVPTTRAPGSPAVMGGPLLGDPVMHKGCSVSKIELFFTAGNAVDANVTIKSKRLGAKPWSNDGKLSKSQLDRFNREKQWPFRVMAWCDADVVLENDEGEFDQNQPDIFEIVVKYERWHSKVITLSKTTVRWRKDIALKPWDLYVATLAAGEFKDTFPTLVDPKIIAP